MTTSTAGQVTIGFRRAGGIIVGFVICYLALDGITRGYPPGTAHFWGLSSIAWGELAVAAAAMLATAKWWARVLPGYFFVVGLKSVAILARGRSLMSPHQPVSRSFSLELAVFCFLCTLLTIRFSTNRPNPLQSLVLTILVLATLWEAVAVTSRIPVPLMVGLAIVAGDWCLQKFRNNRRPGGESGRVAHS